MSPFNLESGDYLNLIVEDEGCGIPEELLPRIFEPFFTTKEQGKGTGLGLSTVYGTIQQHKGEIRVYSEVNRGTSFHIFLPLSKQEKPLDDLVSEENIAGAGTLLVVDDEKTMRLSAQRILESFGYDVLTASNGREALELYRRESQKIDLVLLDMIMPLLNGRDCFIELRAISPALPVLLASGYFNPEEIQALKQEGLSGFISKPYRRYELGRLVFDTLKERD